MITTRLLCIALLLALAGCVHYPMGLSRSEWEALPSERQAELRAEQYRIDAEERVRRQEADRQRATAAAAAEQERRQQIVQRRSEARYGDIVVVTLQGGAFEWKDGRYPLQPLAFELVRGERRMVRLVGVKEGKDATLTSTDDWVVSLSGDGQTVTMDDSPFGASIRLVNTGDWERGKRYSLANAQSLANDDRNPAGMTATVRYKPGPGMPRRVIIEEW